MTNEICTACETVAHCKQHGCIPVQNAPFWDASPPGYYEEMDKVDTWLGRIRNALLVAAMMVLILSISRIIAGVWP